MDVAKVIVSVFVSRLAGSASALVVSTFVASTAVPVWGQIVCVVALGILFAYALNEIDENNNLSIKLTDCIRKSLGERQEIEEWNTQVSPLYRDPFFHGVY